MTLDSRPYCMHINEERVVAVEGVQLKVGDVGVASRSATGTTVVGNR